ncbi:MAG TPA: hypothetical protein GXX58_07880 [Gelria sp.]|nr:hypothetical protein [Gelria sp.]
MQDILQVDRGRQGYMGGHGRGGQGGWGGQGGTGGRGGIGGGKRWLKNRVTFSNFLRRSHSFIITVSRVSFTTTLKSIRTSGGVHDDI